MLNNFFGHYKRNYKKMNKVCVKFKENENIFARFSLTIGFLTQYHQNAIPTLRINDTFIAGVACSSLYMSLRECETVREKKNISSLTK